MLDSMSALIPAICSLTCRDAADIFRRRQAVNHTISGTSANTTSASFHWMVSRMMNAPTSVTREMNRSSGPWWASSTTSNRSLTTRDISCPVRFLS